MDRTARLCHHSRAALAMNSEWRGVGWCFSNISNRGFRSQSHSSALHRQIHDSESSSPSSKILGLWKAFRIWGMTCIELCSSCFLYERRHLTVSRGRGFDPWSFAETAFLGFSSAPHHKLSALSRRIIHSFGYSWEPTALSQHPYSSMRTSPWVERLYCAFGVSCFP